MYTWYFVAFMALVSLVGSLLIVRSFSKHQASHWPVPLVLGLVTALFFVSTKLGLLMVVAIVLESIGWYQLLKYLLQKSIMDQLQGAMGVRISYRSGMPEEEFQRMIGPVVKAAPKSAGVLLFRRVLYCAENGLPIARQNIQRLHRLKDLDMVDARDRFLFPKAKFVLIATWSRVYFSSNLSFVGYRDFAPEVSTIVSRILAEHCLRPEDCESLRWLKILSECDSDRNGLYGGPGRPFPDQRWDMFWFMDESHMSLYFDEGLKLLVAYSDSPKDDTILWERPGARQPELYREELTANGS